MSILPIAHIRILTPRPKVTINTIDISEDAGAKTWAPYYECWLCGGTGYGYCQVGYGKIGR